MARLVVVVLVLPHHILCFSSHLTVISARLFCQSVLFVHRGQVSSVYFLFNRILSCPGSKVQL